jgi:LPXTG-site transpeptidase (sortase) family protein
MNYKWSKQSISCVIILLYLISVFNITPVYAEDSWINVTSPAEFSNIRNNLSGNYRLMVDIDLASYPNWLPIGSAASPFTGQLDGNGKVVRNLSITNTIATDQGLISVIGATGRVSNLSIESANITAGNRTGILTGSNYGSIGTTSTSGIVSGYDNVGGLVGENHGIMANVFSISTVSGKNMIGGLCGINNGTISDSYSASQVFPALLNTYIQFDGVDDYISIPHQSYYLTDTFTLEAWFEWDEADRNDVDFIVGKGFEQFEIHTGGGAASNGIRFIPASRLKTVKQDGTAYQDAPNVLNTGWFHVATVWDFQETRDFDLDGDLDRVYAAQIYINGDAQDIYHNGVKIGKIASVAFEISETNPNADNISDFFIGKRSDGSFPFKGKISDVRFWNTARTSDQIADDKHKQLSGTEPGLVGYWKLDEIVETAVIDSSSKNNPGTVYGATAVTSSSTDIGGLVGSGGIGTVNNSYYDQEVSGLSDTGKGIPKTTLAMKSVNTFTGWDSGLWRLTTGEYPDFIEYSLSYSAGENGSISGELQQNVRPNGYGSEVTANPVAGYIFRQWSDSVTNASRTDVGITNNLSVSAGFDLRVTTSISVADSSIILGETTVVTITFSEAVTDFTIADLSVPNAVLSNLESSDGGITWTAILTPVTSVTDPTNIIILDNTGVLDGAGNAGIGTTNSNNYAVDTNVPTVTIEQAGSQSDPTNTSPLLFTATFSEIISDFTNEDVSFTGSTATGSLTAAISGTGPAYNISVSGMTSSGTVAVSIPAGKVTDSAGNLNTVSTSIDNTVNYDVTKPTATITVADTTLGLGQTSLVTITFSEAITSFTTADLTVGSGSLSEPSSSDGGITWTATLSPAADVTDSTNVITLDNSGIQDAAGNSGIGTTDSNNYAVDTSPPDTTLDSKPANSSNSNTAEFIFSGIDDFDVVVTSFQCKLDTAAFETCASPKEFSGLAEGSHTFYVRAVDLVGNTDSTPASYTWAVDTISPDTTLTSMPNNPSASTLASFSFSGSDGSGSGVASFQCQLDGGTFGTCSSPQDYTDLSTGSHTFHVRAIDLVGNVDSTPVIYTWTIDTAQPTVTMTSTNPNPTNTSPIGVTVQFSEPVSGFTASEISVGNGSLSNFAAVDGDTYTFDLIPTGQGLITADIVAGVAEDGAGNGNTAAAQFSRMFDSVKPTVTLNQSGTQLDPTSVWPVYYTAIFSEPVSGFETGDVTLSGSAGATTGIVTGSGTTYTIAVSGMTAGGTIIASIPADIAQDSALNGNASSTSSDNSVNYTFDTATTMVSSINPTIMGQNVTFTATVSSTGGTPTGTVEFRDGSTVLGTGTLDSGTASFTTSVLPSGTHNITATYLASVNHNGSQSTAITQIVNQAATTTSLTSSGSPAGIGSLLTFTATVIANTPGTGIPTGLVTFYDGGTSMGAGMLTTDGLTTLSTTTLSIGSHPITAVYAGDVNYYGSTTLPGITQLIDGPPGVFRISSVADTGDGQILEGEHTNIALIQLLVVFNKEISESDAQDPANYALTRNESTPIAINSIVYDSTTLTATLNVNNGVELPDGQYRFTVRETIKDTLDTMIGEDFIRTFFVDSDTPLSLLVLDNQNNFPITHGGTSNVRFSSLEITFTEDVNNAGGGIDPDDVTNPQNYLLFQPGPNGIYDTTSCDDFNKNDFLPFDDDIYLPTGLVTYSNNNGTGPYIATIQLNGGTPLANGSYQLLLCGSTSIVDLAGNPLNNGMDEALLFNVLIQNSIAINPLTGFTPDVVTKLREQPVEKAYTDLSDLWIEIPTLVAKFSITGVPLENNGWDISWLNQQVGWLGGTAYPTWPGNTVLTAHAYTADGIAGPFAFLKDLGYGQLIFVHQDGKKYTYAVRDNFLIHPTNTYWLTKHEGLDWLTLITCQHYDENLKDYLYRRVVRAVLIRVE